MATTPITTFTSQTLIPMFDGEDALQIPVSLPASVTYAAGTVLGELTATPGTYKAYASGNADGSQVPKVILKYACATDASGNITIGTTNAGGMWGETQLNAPAYFAGTFRLADLVGLDANAVTVLGARFITGSIAAGSGIVRIP